MAPVHFCWQVWLFHQNTYYFLQIVNVFRGQPITLRKRLIKQLHLEQKRPLSRWHHLSQRRKRHLLWLRSREEATNFYYAKPISSAENDLCSFYALAEYSFPSRTTSSSTTSSAAVQPTSSENLTPKSASWGLSIFAKAGIGIGIGLGIELLLCPAVIFQRRYWKRVFSVDPLVLPAQSHSPSAAEEIHGRLVPAEMNASGRTPFEIMENLLE